MGFSLIEMAVALFVIALLLGSLLVPLTTQVDKRRYAETEKQIEHIREALIGFALINRHLPCPAKSATDGREDRTGNTCTLVGGNPKRDGFIPWVTLGVTPADAWDNLLRYSVADTFSNSTSSSHFTFTTPGDIQVCAGTPPCKPLDPTAALTNDDVPAVIISHGKNGFGATALSGVVQPVPGGWAGDEKTNAQASQAFVFRTRTDNTGAAGGQFDDVVVWISRNQLFARMVSAGRLP